MPENADGQAQFLLQRDGRIKDVRVINGTGNREIDSAIAADLVAKSTDVHTLGVMINGNLTVAKLLNPATPFDPAKDFVGVLENLWWRLDSALTTEDCYYNALIALLDSIRHGTTTLIDHHASPNACDGSLDVIAGAFGQAGLRGCG